MATITKENVQQYIDQGLIDPAKIKIDLNKTKTAGDNFHKWVTLESAINSGYDFNFDYDVPEIKTPRTNKVTELPELVVTPQKKRLVLNPIEEQNRVNAELNKSEARQANSYFQLEPSLTNIGKGIYHWAKSKPWLLGENEHTERLTGVAGDVISKTSVFPKIASKTTKLIRKGKKYYNRLFHPKNYEPYRVTTKLPISEQEAREIIRLNLKNEAEKVQKSIPGIRRLRDTSEKYDLDDLRKQQFKTSDSPDILFNKMKKENSSWVQEKQYYDTYLDDGSMIVTHSPVSEELNELIEKTPHYVRWAMQNKLDPTKSETAAKFIEKQSRSLRGTVGANLEQTRFWNEGTSDLKGGDKLQLKNGIYSGNSNYLGERYSAYPSKFVNSSETVNEQPGVISTLQIDYNIDPNLPPIKQLQRLAEQDIAFDIFPNRGFETNDPTQWYRIYQESPESFKSIHPKKSKIGRVRSNRFKNKTKVKTIQLPFSSEYKDPLPQIFERGSLYPQKVLNMNVVEPRPRKSFISDNNLEDIITQNIEENPELFTRFIYNSPTLADYYTKLWKRGVDQKKIIDPLLQSRIKLASSLRRQSNQATKFGLIATGTGLGSLGSYLLLKDSDDQPQNTIQQQDTVQQNDIYNIYNELNM